MLIHWIWLAHLPGVANREKLALLRHFSDAESIYFAQQDAYDLVQGLSPEAKADLENKNLSSSEAIMARCDRESIHLLTIRDAAYPARLKNIADPPVLLYYKGRLPDFDGNPVIGVVGTRKASAYGLQTAKRIGYQIGRCGGIVVSGMAFGIDAMAMSGCLTAGQPVIGVLGCGVDMIYPVSNRALFADVEKFGCILSEFAPGTEPFKWNFPKRNRIISGLSCGVLVVEAPQKSGALITARQAADQGRDVFVVPGNIDIPSFTGSNRLLRDGAIAVSSGWDILSEYEALYPDKIHKDTAPAHQTVYEDEKEKADAMVAQSPLVPGKKENREEEIQKNPIDNQSIPNYIDVNTILPKLSAEEGAIVMALKSGPRLVDDVIAETGLTTGKVLALLTILELKGVLRRLPGKHISLKEMKWS